MNQRCVYADVISCVAHQSIIGLTSISMQI